MKISGNEPDRAGVWLVNVHRPQQGVFGCLFAAARPNIEFEFYGQSESSLVYIKLIMADELDAEAVAALRKKRQFKKFTFRGLDVEKLIDLTHDELLNIVHARARRRLQRGLKRKPMALIKKLRKALNG